MRSRFGVSSVARVPISSCTATITARCSPRSMDPTVRSRSSACARPRTSGKGQSAAPSTTSTRSSGIAEAEVRGFGSRCESVATIPTRVDSALRESGNSSLEANSRAGGSADRIGSEPTVSSPIRLAPRGFPKQARDPMAGRRRWPLPRMGEARRGFGNRSHGMRVRGLLRG
jgi:hypothetical protein